MKGEKMKADRKAVWGWALYDWANSAFATTVMAGFFPVFFKAYWSHGADAAISTAQLGFGNAAAGFLVALMAPILGAIADTGSAKKQFLIFFAYLGALMTVTLFFVGQGNWWLAILIYIIGIIGFSGANIFYDALLPDVVGNRSIDYVSSFGFALGYLGGGLLFLANVLMTLKPHFFGIPDAQTAVRYSFLTVGIWWAGFTIFTILWVSEKKPPQCAASKVPMIRRGFHQLIQTLRKIRYLKTVFLFLVAYWFYIDGVDTIIRMAVDYGLSLGFDSSDLIVSLLIVQFIGFPAALVFGKLGEHWGVKKSIFLAIGIYMLVTLWGAFMNTKIEFYGLAAAIGLVQGGIQSLSRSYYSRLIPENQTAEFFGFYNMLGKFAAILGPALMATVSLISRKCLLPPSPTHEQILLAGRLASRLSIASILILFIIGGVLFYFVDEKKGKAEIKQLSNLDSAP